MNGFKPHEFQSDTYAEGKPRRPNKERCFEAAKQRLDRLYFGTLIVYGEEHFERRFRVPRILFALLEQDVLGKGKFKERSEGTGRPGIHPKIKLLAALKVMAYDMAYDQVDELCESSKSSTRNAFLPFLEECTSAFEAEYLRRLTEKYLRRIFSINQSCGFPDCINRWYFQH